MKSRRLLKKGEVLRVAGCGKTKLDEMIRNGDFPDSITLPDGRTRLWDGNEVDDWYDALVAAGKAARECPTSEPLNALFGHSMPSAPKSGMVLGRRVEPNSVGKCESGAACAQGEVQ